MASYVALGTSSRGGELLLKDLIRTSSRGVELLLKDLIRTSSRGVEPVSYTHLTLPTNREV